MHEIRWSIPPLSDFGFWKKRILFTYSTKQVKRVILYFYGINVHWEKLGFCRSLAHKLQAWLSSVAGKYNTSTIISFEAPFREKRDLIFGLLPQASCTKLPPCKNIMQNGCCRTANFISMSGQVFTLKWRPEESYRHGMNIGKMGIIGQGHVWKHIFSSHDTRHLEKRVSLISEFYRHVC